MSDEKRPIINPENQPTSIVVTFVVAILALVIGFYNVKQIREVAVFYGKLSIMTAQKAADAQTSAAKNTDLEARIAKLEAELALVKGAAAPAQPAVAPVESKSPAKTNK